MTLAYPLQWPDGWPRWPDAERKDGRHEFRRPLTSRASPYWTFADARRALLDELRRLGAVDVVISSNFKPSRDGLPVEGNRRPMDQGIAIYFRLRGTSKTMARDRYTRAEENMRALTLSIEAIRSLERHGGSHMMERAFSGFEALPPPPSTHWSDVLDVSRDAGEAEIDAAFRHVAKTAHPDAGGSNEAMAALVAARDAGLAEARRRS